MNRGPCMGRNKLACEREKGCEWIETNDLNETKCREKKKVEEEEGSESEEVEVEESDKESGSDVEEDGSGSVESEEEEEEDGSGSDVESDKEDGSGSDVEEAQAQTRANKTPTPTPEQSDYNTKEMIINLHLVNDKAMGNIIMLDTGNKYTIDGDKILLESTMSNLELHNEMDILCNNMNATRIHFIETLKNPQHMQTILQKHLEGYKVDVIDFKSQTPDVPNTTVIPFRKLLIDPDELTSILNNKLDGYNVKIAKYPFIGNVTTNNMIIQLAITNKETFNGTITMINTKNQYTIKDNEIDGDAKKVDNFEQLIDEHCKHMNKTTIESKHPVRIKTNTTPKDMGEIFTKYLSNFNVNVQRKIMFDDNYDTLLNNIQNTLIINGYKISVHEAYAEARPDQYDPKNYLDSDYDINKDPYPYYLDEGEGITEGVKEIKKIVEEVATLLFEYPTESENKDEVIKNNKQKAVYLLEELSEKPVPPCKETGFDENWKKCRFTLEKQYDLASKLADNPSILTRNGNNIPNIYTKIYTNIAELKEKLKEKSLSIGFNNNWVKRFGNSASNEEEQYYSKKMKQIDLVNDSITTKKNMFEKIKWKPDHYLEEKDELGLQRMALDVMEYTTNDNGEQMLPSFEPEYKDLQNPMQIYVKKRGLRTAISYMNSNRKNYNQAKNMYIDYMKQGKQ